MSQQINLRSTETKPVSQGLWFVLALLVCALALLGLASYRTTQAGEAEAAARMREAREIALQAELAAVERQSEAGQVTVLERQIAARRTELQSLSTLTTALEGGALGSRSGPSVVMRALAGVAESGVWLEGIDIDSSGKQVKLRGNALGYESVVRYSERLNRTLQPLGIRFDSIEITGTSPAAGMRTGAQPPLTFTLN